MPVAAVAPHEVFLGAIALIALGYILRKTGVVPFSGANVPAKIVMNVTLPALVLRTIPQVEFGGDIIILALLPVLYNAVVLPLALWLFRNEPPARRGLLTMSCIGFNNGLFAFPIVGALWGLEALKLLAVFDVGNGLVLLGGNYIIGAYFAGGGRLDARGAMRVVAKSFLSSVPVIAFTLGLLLKLINVELPLVIMRPISTAADANGALALLVLGLFQSFSRQGWDARAVGRVYALRYFTGIVAGLLCYLFLPMDELTRRLMMMAFILPIGMSVIPYAVQFEFDARLATTLVNGTIFVSFALMWLIITVL